MGGRNGGSRSLLETLRRRLESCKTTNSTVDEIVSHLRSTYPDYQRTKHQTLARFVQQALQSHPNHVPKATPTKPTHNNDGDDEEEEEDGNQSSSRKRRKRIDASEERLKKIEASHVRRRRMNQSDNDSQTPSSASISSESEGSVSTSEDAIYGEKFEPAIDLMKTMLRNSYNLGTKEDTANKNKNKKKEHGVEEKNVEVEVADNKATNVVAVVNGRERKSSKLNLKGSVSNGNGGGEMKMKEGPRFRDLGGMKEVLEELKMEVIVPLLNPQLLQRLGVRPMAGILLHGPPGCGKTKLAHTIANEAGLPFYQVSATELVSGVSGSSEENIRELFSKAYKTAPSIVFIDEIDAIASKRENLQREMEKRIVTQLMTSMDQSTRLMQPENDSESSGVCPGYVLVIGATNRPDALDPALRRPGRFDREIVVGIPDESAREEILSVVTRNLRLEGSFDLKQIARSTPGFVGADLTALANKAGYLAFKRIVDERKCKLSLDGYNEEWWTEIWSPEVMDKLEEMDKLAIKMSDFEEAVKTIQPSLRREGFSKIPNVKWEDVGGLDVLRKEFEHHILGRIKYPEIYEKFGMDLETGFLLYGPPGCGKTLIAKALANEAGASFIHVKGPELLNKYVGESEHEVRKMFTHARTCAPCIIFFDEVDALTTNRGKEGGWVVERLLNQLLVELDGSEKRQGVFVIGATNRPEVMDPALLRPGRFGKPLYVPLPSADQRVLILKALARKKLIDASVDLSSIAKMDVCENLSGADLAALMNDAAMAAIDESKESSIEASAINMSHFEVALGKISPSVSDKQIRFYQNLSERFGGIKLK